ncbi:O-antigen ligase family protein [Arcobacter sp. s6]|jgi:O-antigen ligase|uniref:O-antigen ligase family protein n=1 Tax=Arcobacter sp. s6 TaxID=3230363 RepID=UPI0034A079A2
MIKEDSFIKNINVEVVVSILFPFLILFTYIGRGIYNSTLFIILCSILYLIYRNKELKVFKDGFFKTFIIFTAFVAITVPFSTNVGLSISKYGSFFFSSISVLISGLYLYSYSINKQKNLIFALYILFFSSICMEIITIISIYFDVNALAYIKTLGEVKAKVANGFHLIEIFTSAIIPLSIFLYYLKPSKLKLMFIIISFIGILASTSRTAMLATIVSLSLFLLIKNKGNIFNKEFLFFIVSLFIASFLAFEISPQIQERVKSFQSTFSSKGDRMSGRFTVYEESFDRFKTAILTGHGIKSSTDNYIIIKHKDSNEEVKHSHNIWLELLLDSGLIGAFSFLIFISYLIKFFYIKTRNISSIHKATIFATLCSIFLSSLSSWSIWSGNHIGPILAIILIVSNIDKIKLKN